MVGKSEAQVSPSVFSPIVAGVWRMSTWQMDARARLAWIEACLEMGITTFDHANIYGDYSVEQLFGEALALRPALRDKMQLVTKCGIKLLSSSRPTHGVKSYDTSRAHILASVDNSLQQLRTDVIDVLLLHRPDPLMDPEEVVETFGILRAAGKVRAFGVSNFAPSQFAMLHRRVPLVTNQVELHPLQAAVLTDGTLDQAVDLGVPPMIWSPLAGGRLFAPTDAAAMRVHDVLSTVAAEHSVSVATVAFAWVRRHPARPLPITGSGRIDALREAVASLTIELTRDEWFRILEAGSGREVA
jgi:predicted oxidoreductase